MNAEKLKVLVRLAVEEKNNFSYQAKPNSHFTK